MFLCLPACHAHLPCLPPCHAHLPCLPACLPACHARLPAFLPDPVTLGMWLHIFLHEKVNTFDLRNFIHHAMVFFVSFCVQKIMKGINYFVPSSHNHTRGIINNAPTVIAINTCDVSFTCTLLQCSDKYFLNAMCFILKLIL